MLRLVGFPDPERALDAYPFELSGGLRQRAMIAMALICRPALLIADEPTTALDVTVQAQILKLVKDLQQELGMAVLMITHDLGVVANMADELVVMYHGRIVEAGSAEDVFRRAQHPYLKALLRAVPRFHMAEGERLTPIREVRPETGRLLAGERPDEPTGIRRPAASGSPRPHQALWQPQGGPFRRRGRGRRAGGGRCELPDRARRMPRPGRRKRLRQEHVEQDRHARADAGPRRGGVRRQRHTRGPVAAAGEGPVLLSPAHPVHVPGPVQRAQPAHDGVRHRVRAAGRAPAGRARGAA